MAPLGVPVVPDVYMIMQTSSRDTGTSTGSAGATASSSSYSPATAMRWRNAGRSPIRATTSACSGPDTSTMAPESTSM